MYKLDVHVCVVCDRGGKRKLGNYNLEKNG